MKRNLPVILTAAVLLALAAGCGNRGSGRDDTQTMSTPAASAPVDLKPGQLGPPAVTPVPSDPNKIDGKAIKWKSMPDGLKYYDIKVGTGANPKSGQTVSVQYTGTLMDGTKFDSSYDHGSAPIDFPIGVGQVIKGWDEGVPSMKVGGKRRLMIPGDLAYGASPPPGANIPANATLVFDIELVGVK